MAAQGDYVGVRELKAKLSEYLQRVAKGERIVVTDRGRPCAELGPIPSQSSLQRGFDEGWIEPPRRTQLGAPLLLQSQTTVADVLGDDRG